MYQGRGRFVARDAIEVNGKRLRFRAAVIATGGQAALPPIAGLAAAPFHTNATLFNLTELPPRVVVLGGGPIGLEMAQALACFGARVTVVLRGEKLLPKEDPDAAAIVRGALEPGGVEFVLGAQCRRVGCSAAAASSAAAAARRGRASRSCSRAAAAGRRRAARVRCLLVATGRKPNVSGWARRRASRSTRRAACASTTRCATNPNIYAVGDVCTPFQFTHVAGAMAGIVVENALFGRAGLEPAVPWCTYTAPRSRTSGCTSATSPSAGCGATRSRPRSRTTTARSSRPRPTA